MDSPVRVTVEDIPTIVIAVVCGVTVLALGINELIGKRKDK